ncbi:hypothetical protein SAMN06269250_6136 [Spirosoma fluviale]|uniref:Transposase n=1 Tax=Spirosoma fluviale TaxID=1597977 RepID=A0A286GSN9_9BACT|nr:hypothetical protein SAMN06269250_6136 [Spirosoma fluviale]
MLTNHPNISIRQLEGVPLGGPIGFSRQGYYQYWQRQADQVNHDADILQLVKKVRQDHPRIGGRKLYWLLQDAFLERAAPQVILDNTERKNSCSKFSAFSKMGATSMAS